MTEFTQSPLFGIVLSIFAYEFGVQLNRKLRTPVANPLLIAITLIILVLNIFHIPVESYQQGGNIISLFLGPATAVLAVSVYSQLETLKKNLLPIIAGCLAGAIASMGSALLLCKAFGLDDKLVASMIPKSVTTPIAMEVSKNLGGIVPVTIAAVILTGIMGAVLAPILIRLFRIDNSVAAGVAIGASSHAVGTSKAIEIGETEGAMSGITAINTIKSIIGIDPETMSGYPSIGGKSSVSGYSGKAVKPIALRFISDLAHCERLDGLELSGMGGIESWHDALEFILLGCRNIQVTTAVMQYGYRIIDDLISGMGNYMVTHGISSISELVGAAVDNIIPADELDRNTLIFPHLNKAKCLGCGRCVISCSDAGHQALKMVSGKAALNAKKCVEIGRAHV